MMRYMIAFLALLAGPLTLHALRADDARKFSTPEACFEAYAKLPANTGNADRLAFYTPISGEMIVGKFAFDVAQASSTPTKNGEACNELVKKYSLHKIDFAGLLAEYVRPEKPRVQTMYVLIGSTIKDKTGFLKEADVALNIENKSVADEKNKEPFLKKIKDLKVDGDVAQGTAVTIEGETPFVFIRKDGDWRIALDRNEAEWRKKN